jgi:hypothetical protein
MWNWDEIARSFDFRNDAKPKMPTVPDVDLYKGLIQKTKDYKISCIGSWHC